MHALEANLRVLMANFHLARVVFNLFFLALDLNKVMLGIETGIFAGSESFEQRLFLEYFVHIIGTGLRKVRQVESGAE